MNVTCFGRWSPKIATTLEAKNLINRLMRRIENLGNWKLPETTVDVAIGMCASGIVVFQKTGVSMATGMWPQCCNVWLGGFNGYVVHHFTTSAPAIAYIRMHPILTETIFSQRGAECTTQ